MEASAVRVRDEKKDARINLIIQLVFFLPALALFGFTVFNIVTAVLFLGFAAVRFLYPTERMRKYELVSSLIVGALWLLVVVIL
jgi:predicted membrane protein